MPKKKTDEARSEKLSQLQSLISGLNENIERLRKIKKSQLVLLQSVSLGLYEEIEKLCKKAPAESLTDLALQQINDVIRDTKEMVTADIYVQRLNEFVAAGDNPELRDALMVLRQIRTGLERFQVHLNEEIEKATSKRDEALFVSLGVQLDLQGEAVDRVSLGKYVNGQNIFSHWMMRRGDITEFNVALFDQTDLTEYFG